MEKVKRATDSLDKRFIILMLLMIFGVTAQAQWSSSGNNYTLGALGIGATATSEKLTIVAHGTQRSAARLGATGSGIAGIFFDASNGDWAGSDYGSLIQYDDLSIALNNYGNKPIHFRIAYNDIMTVTASGNVGIMTTTPDAPLTVNGQIHAEEIKVDLGVAAAPDYVFEPDYNLRSLGNLEAYIREYQHLPEIPSAEEMKENGLRLKEMNLLLLKKIEELVLYVIELKKENEGIRRRLEEISNEK